MKRKGYVVAVAGATGAVGQEMIRILEERKFPVRRLVLLASERSVGKRLSFRDEDIRVEQLTEDSFYGVDIALFSAGSERSKRFAPAAVEAGAVVIDNSSAFRMDPEVPLVVPEVNPHTIHQHRGIIANPNCSTIQMVVVLKPIHDAAKVERVVVATYQSVSGTGHQAVEELDQQVRALLNFRDPVCHVYPHQIAFNILPHIDTFLENGYTREEMKMIDETKKIMGDDSIRVTATTARVPVFYGHSEAVNVETAYKLTADQCRDILSRAPGVIVVDEPESNAYPMALDAVGQDAVFVGRIREDHSIENGLNMWIVADNLRKGAALNAVQIAECLIEG
jgi:aspartate-semialdehyde dehydrogenase